MYCLTVFQLWGYSHSARTQSHRVTSHKVLPRYHQTQLSTLSKIPSPLLEFWHANCSHCLLDDTQWGRITWRQTNAILQKISLTVHCHQLLKHSGTLCLSIGWKRPHVLIQPVFPITPPSTPTHWPQLHSKSKMLQTNNVAVILRALQSGPKHQTSKGNINHSVAEKNGSKHPSKHFSSSNTNN